MKDDPSVVVGCLACLGMLILFFLLACLFGWVVMLLWNWLAPVFWLAAPHLTFWQGVGVGLVLEIVGTVLGGGR